MIRKLGALITLAMAFALSHIAVAYAQPRPWQMNLPEPADERMSEIIWFHDLLLYTIVIISLFVLGLLVVVAVRFNAKANPVPSATTHNTTLEVLWTVVPVLILTAIAIPSFRILYFQETLPPADLTVKAIGKQWYWTYEYPDHGNLTFDANMIVDRLSAPATPGGPPRLMGTNNHVVVPVNKTVRLITTGADVIHAWTIPNFGVKIDAVPGRLNQAWFKPNREGAFYGQCSELCGARHAFMPIVVEVVSQERFDQWVAEARTRFGAVDAQPATKFAAATPEKE